MLGGRPLSRRQFAVQLPRHDLGLLALCAPLLSGCLADAGKCGRHQEHNAFGNCACVEGYRLDERLRCVRCGQNEVSAGERCDCAAGFGRTREGACEPLPEGLGAPCSSTLPCLDEAAPYCAMDGASGYCTVSGCQRSDECRGGYACDLTSQPSVCRAPPTGQGAACQGSEDCEGHEASFCETLSSNVCLVPDCEVGGDDCFEGWSCCDLREFGLPTLCVTEGSCPAP